MFNEILKIIPKIDSKDLQAMQTALQTRFAKVAKGFGKGLVNAFKGGGIAGAALGLIDKLLNPLQEVQESIDRTLKTSDDLATNAEQFNTTTSKLYKLTALAKSQGLDNDNLFMLITKFQTAVAQSKADPNDKSVSSVREFQGADTADEFFKFITSLQGATKDQQLLIQQQIFGEKQILKMAEFLQSDFPKLFKDTNLDKINDQKFNAVVQKGARLEGLDKALEVSRDTDRIFKNGGAINESMIRAKDKSERIAMEKEALRIKSYTDLSALSDTTAQIFTLVDKGVGLLGSFIPTITKSIDKLVMAADKVMNSGFVRGVKGLFGGKDD